MDTRTEQEILEINLVLSHPEDSPFPPTWVAQLVSAGSRLLLGAGPQRWDAVWDLLRRVTQQGDTFTCAVCGGTFKKTRSDDEAWAEAEALWSERELGRGVAVVCDDCFAARML